MPVRGEEVTAAAFGNSCTAADSSQLQRPTAGNQKASVAASSKRATEDYGPEPDSAAHEPPEKRKKDEPFPSSAGEPSTQTNAETDDMTFGSNVLDVPTNVTRDPLETVDEVILRVSNESAKLLARFQEHFSESEGFELFCPARLDELLKQAHGLEMSYVEQRKKLKERLARTLQML